MNFFEELTIATKQEQKILFNVPQIKDALRGDITLETYIAYLTQAYHHVKHTTPLLMLTGSRISCKQEWLRNVMAEYIAEELGHQEWILSDIKNSGGDAEAVRNGTASFATEMMISYAYDYISRINPLGFLGMVFVLEGTSIELATKGASSVQKSLELDKNCFSYLSSHGSLDLEHMKFFEKNVNKIEDEQDKQTIIYMAKRMFILFSKVFSSIPHKVTQNAA